MQKGCFFKQPFYLCTIMMKYARLTKEQFEELHAEFANFLATQSITADEWSKIKEEQPTVAEQELDVFSDLIWEGVLGKVEYLEHISARQMHLFHLGDDQMKLLGVKVMDEKIDLTTKEGFGWFKENYHTDAVEFVKANKSYSEEKNIDKFKLIQQGAVITKGALYQWFDQLINN